MKEDIINYAIKTCDTFKEIQEFLRSKGVEVTEKLIKKRKERRGNE